MARTSFENDPTPKNIWLYVLSQESGKYYVGITSQNVNKRMNQHVNGIMGAKWTRKYAPLKIVNKKLLGKMTYQEAEKFEQKVTLKYIDRYGLKNVRGGNLTYDGDYFRLGNRYLEDEDFSTLLAVLFLVVIIFAQGVLYVFK